MEECNIHHEQSVGICVAHDLQRACQKCVDSGDCKQHAANLASPTDLAEYFKNKVVQAQSVFALAKSRHMELTSLSQQAVALKKQAEDQLLRLFIQALKDQTKLIKVQRRKVVAIQRQIEAQLTIRYYFQQLKENNLLEFKINVSNKTGLQTFREKCQRLNTCTSKWQLDQTKRLAIILEKEYEDLKRLYENSLVSKLKEYMDEGSRRIRKNGVQ